MGSDWLSGIWIFNTVLKKISFSIAHGKRREMWSIPLTSPAHSITQLTPRQQWIDDCSSFYCYSVWWWSLAQVCMFVWVCECSYSTACSYECRISSHALMQIYCSKYTWQHNIKIHINIQKSDVCEILYIYIFVKILKYYYNFVTILVNAYMYNL